MGIVHVLKTLQNWQEHRLTWAIMLGTAAFLELCALYFQYGMMLDPCEKCVYQRLAVIILALAAIIIMIAPRNLMVRVVGYGVWIFGAMYGLKVAISQMADYVTPNFSCTLWPTFPFDLPLQDWLPELFMPTAICGTDTWLFLGMNMAQWMVIIFSIYLVAAAVCIISFFAGSLLRSR